MLAVIGYTLPLALIVWFSPTRVMAATLLLFSGRARPVAGGYAVGWVLGISLCVVAFTIGAALATAATSHSTTGSTPLLYLVVGLTMIAMAGVAWRSRPRPGVKRPTPRWMLMIDRLTPMSALGLGFAFSIVSPTHLLAIAAAGAAIAGAGLSVGDQIAIGLVFIVICTSSVTVPVGAAILAPQRTEVPLRRLHDWLEKHGPTTVVVVFLVIGVDFLGKAIAALS
ncbi:GAP family protein [Microbacterium sp. ASV49]|uniref:GAP family protein n=1 Tax=Microbacterium candidum TaxID=3041922 RepID=A0ABT7MYP8_9MICO|nr:GAP family protein [Microbacterium sp. ASV49]MDL9979574.1 GAP family protein [Microbacterium sp. ASV49]